MMQSVTESSVGPPIDLYKVYVDTNVFHYLIGLPPKNQHAKSALTELLYAVQNDAITCVTSSLALAEEYDIRKRRAFIKREIDRGNIRWTPSGVGIRSHKAAEPLDSRTRTRAVKVVRQGLQSSVVRLEDPASWPKEFIDLLCRCSNLHWPDALHLAIALVLRCDYIVTDDEEFYEEIVQRLKSATGNIHRPVARILESVYGLTGERLQRPLIEPLLLSDPGAAGCIRDWAMAPSPLW